MLVSLVVPMLNEARHVERLVDDVAAQDYEGELEVVVADGGSTDGSVEKLRRAAARARLALTLVDNPGRTQSCGLNRAIPRTRGELIVRLDCHTRYPSDIVRRCVETSEETGAWNVGGVLTAVGETPTERAIAAAYDSPFGGIAWTRHLSRTDPVDADVVYYGAFRREVFERIGLFDEGLPICELEDVCRRIRHAGGRVVFDPRIRLLYTPRSTLAKLFVQYYRYGLWKVAATRKHRRVLSARSLAPLAFVFSLAALGSASAVLEQVRPALAAEAALYLAAALAFAVGALRRRHEPLRLLPRTVAAFSIFHLAHGLGQTHGWLRALRPRCRPVPVEPACIWRDEARRESLELGTPTI